jgi:hypothetical protein
MKSYQFAFPSPSHSPSPRVESLRSHCDSRTAICSAMSAILKDEDFSAIEQAVKTSTAPAEMHQLPEKLAGFTRLEDGIIGSVSVASPKLKRLTNSSRFPNEYHGRSQNTI